MTMTPNNILATTGYIIAGIMALIGLVFFLPGGLMILAGLILGTRADSLSSSTFDPEDSTTIEEYERMINGCSEDTEV